MHTRLAMLGHPAHDAGSVDRQGFHQRASQLIAGDGTRDQILAAFVDQPENAILGIGHFQRHLQNGLQRLFQAQARGDQQAGAAQAGQLILFARQVALDARQPARVVDGHGRLVDEVVQHQQLELAERAVFVQVYIERPDGLIGHDQREAGHGLGAGLDFDGVDVQITLFVGKYAAALADGAHPHAVGTRLVAGDRRGPLAGRHARGWLKGALSRIVSVDHGRGAGHYLDGALDDQAQRRFHAGAFARVNAVDGRADLVETGQRVQQLLMVDS